ncbi:hypothetical protein XELAEV_18002255mg [Xenopus laevis]|nr:hypothetical protein XELAEV_18002255mg [Xenopus laevis]
MGQWCPPPPRSYRSTGRRGDVGEERLWGERRGEGKDVTQGRSEGTTWMQEIVDLILQEGDVQKSMRAPCYVKVPFIDLVPMKPMPTGVELAQRMASPRILKTHLPINLLPPSFWEKNVKNIIFDEEYKKKMEGSGLNFHSEL